MKTDFVDVSETKKNLVIEIPAGEVDAEIDRVTRSLGRTVRVPGFRPGKVPVSVVKQRFRDEILHEVAHELVPKAVDQALRDRGVEPIATPEVSGVDVRDGQPLTFTASFETVPPVDPGDSSRSPCGGIHRRWRRPRWTRRSSGCATRRPLRADRRPRARTGRHGGRRPRRRAFNPDGTRGRPRSTRTCHSRWARPVNPPGFDEQLAGMRGGDEKTFVVHYPEDHAIEELRSKDVEYTVKMRAVRRRVLPALDDDLAKEVSDSATLDDLREQVQAGLGREASREADRKLRSDLLKALAARVTFAVPDVLVERDVDRRTQDFIRQLIEERIDPRKAGIDWEAFRNDQRAPAEEAVKAMIVLDEVARRENLAGGRRGPGPGGGGLRGTLGTHGGGRARPAREGRRTGAHAHGNAP